MSFDLDRFDKAELVPRTKRVEVPALKPFFSKSAKPEFLVRGLDVNQLYRATNAEQQRTLETRLLKVVAENSRRPEEILKEISENEETPGENAKRIEMLVAGCVEPELSLSRAVKLAQAFPIEFIHLTNEITSLTGLGFDFAKPEAASQKAKKSA